MIIVINDFPELEPLIISKSYSNAIVFHSVMGNISMDLVTNTAHNTPAHRVCVSIALRQCSAAQ